MLSYAIDVVETFCSVFMETAGFRVDGKVQTSLTLIAFRLIAIDNENEIAPRGNSRKDNLCAAQIDTNSG